MAARRLALWPWLVVASACGGGLDRGAPPQPPTADLATVAPGSGRDCGARLRPLLEAKMTELGVPGAVVLVDVPGGCSWRATLGSASATAYRPLSLHDHFRIGSITKTFTGTAVLQLVDEGLVGLDDPVSRHLDGVPGGDAMTIRQLLQMSSGLYNYSEDLAFNQALDADPARVWTPPELLAIAFAHAPYFAPGAGFHYSNTNTVLLGALVEKVTGRPLARELRRRVFKPLGMRDTSLPDDAWLPFPHPRGYTYGTNVGTLPPACDAESAGRHEDTYASPSWAWAAGGAVSTVHDLRIWARALAEGALLAPETQAERLTWIPTGPAAGAPQYGLHVASYGGIIGHDGALPGFQSFMGFVPARQATVVVLTNVYPDVTCGGPADVLARIIAQDQQLVSP